jgi:hexosaminidase
MTLKEDIDTFNEDLMILKGFKLNVVSGGVPSNDDIHFTIGLNDSELGDEGYSMKIADKIEIKANTSTGIFYATRTILQLIKDNNTIPNGRIRDWPDRPERALQVDNGRKYFTIKWLENHIKELSYIKMNYFYFYLSDNDDFRLECESYPEITSPLHYTKEEIRNLLKLAKKYHVIIVPLIDMPGHMGAILKQYTKTLSLKDSFGGTADSYLDITLDTARAFAKNIIEEYLELFVGPFWHMGADEYKYTNLQQNPQFLEYAQKLYGADAIALDAFFDFINWVNGIVRSHGKTLRIYNDAMSVRNSQKLNNKVQIDKNVVIDYWEGKDVPMDYIDEGYKICNSSYNFLYYYFISTMLIGNIFIYERWETYIYNELREVPKDHLLNLGARYHIWCDIPRLETEGHIANEIRSTLKILAIKLWGGPKLVDKYLEFEKICQNIGLAPGVSYPENPLPGNLCWKKKVYASSTRQDSIYYKEMINDASYNTMWKSSTNKNEWVIIDLDSIYTLDYLKIIWMESRPSEYSVSVSIDSLNWKDVIIPAPKYGRIDEILKIENLARYVRINLNSTSDSVFTLWEIETYGKKYIDTSVQPQMDSNSMFEIKISPNPAVSRIKYKIELKNPALIKTEILNFNGECVFFKNTEGEISNYDEILDISNFANGVYIIKVQVGNTKKSQKFVVLKEK